MHVRHIFLLSFLTYFWYDKNLDVICACAVLTLDVRLCHSSALCRYHDVPASVSQLQLTYLCVINEHVGYVCLLMTTNLCAVTKKYLSVVTVYVS